MKRFSQTLKVALALFVAVFANGTLSTVVAAATPPDETIANITELVTPPEEATELLNPQDVEMTPNESSTQPAANESEIQREDQGSLLVKSGPEIEGNSFQAPACKTSDIYIISKNNNMTVVEIGLKWTAFYKKCTVSLNSYETEGATWPTSGNQTFLDHDEVTLSINNTKHTLRVETPECFGQTDLYLGSTRYDGDNGPLPHYPQPVVPYNIIAAWNGGEHCVIPIPEEPSSKDPCGLNNAVWIIPADTEQVSWSLNDNGELIATTAPRYIFEGQQQVHNYGKAVDSEKLCIVKPEAPRFTDYCGTRTDYVYIPHIKGVIYKINGTIVSAGYHAVSGTSVTVTAEAKTGDYKLVGKSQDPWTYTFANTDCITITKSSLPVTDTNNDGVIGVGDEVQWAIIVTNNSTNKLENFRVQVEDSLATLDNDGIIKYLKAGESVTLTARSTLTEDNLRTCKVTNVAEFFAWYKRSHHHYNNDSRDTSRIFQGDVNNESEYDLSGQSNKAVATFNCPTPGSGGGTIDVAGVSTVTSIPATGIDSHGNPMFIVLASIVAYGATFFLQQRRSLYTAAHNK